MKVELQSFGPVVSGFPRDLEFRGAYFEPLRVEGREYTSKAYILGKGKDGLKVYTGWGKTVKEYDAEESSGITIFGSFRIERKDKYEASITGNDYDSKLQFVLEPSVFFRVYKEIGSVELKGGKAAVSNWDHQVPLLSVNRNPETGEIYIIVEELAGRRCMRHMNPCAEVCAMPSNRPVLYLQNNENIERFTEGGFSPEDYMLFGWYNWSQETYTSHDATLFKNEGFQDEVKDTKVDRSNGRIIEEKKIILERYRDIEFL